MDMAAAFADIGLAFSGLLGGPYGDALIRSETAAVFDDGGSIVTPGTPSARPCQAMADVAGERMRAQEGFAEGDIQIIILAGTLAGAVTTDMRAEILTGIYAGLWSIESKEGDPVGAGWILRGRRING